MEIPITSYYGLRAKVRGTVYSGHPTRTTLGNTLRVICYN